MYAIFANFLECLFKRYYKDIRQAQRFMESPQQPYEHYQELPEEDHHKLPLQVSRKRKGSVYEVYFQQSHDGEEHYKDKKQYQEVISQYAEPGNHEDFPDRYQSKTRSYMYGLIICISGINFGYALTAASVVNMKEVMKHYNVTISGPQISSLLIGMVPIGGVFGAAFNQAFLQFFNRKNSLYVILVILWIGLGLILVRNMYTIVIGRFIQGLAIGLYVSISPILLQEVTPKELRPTVMTMFGLSKSFGCMLANILQIVFIAFGYIHPSTTLLTFNGYLAILQAILYYFIIPQSPMNMIETGQEQQAKKAILQIYKPEYLQDVYNQIFQDYETGLGQPHKQVRGMDASAVLDAQIRKGQLQRAYWFAIHIVIMRQLVGGNCLITFAGQIIKHFNPGLAIHMALILNTVQFFGNLFVVVVLTTHLGRRPILICGTLGMAFSSLVIAVALITHSNVINLIFMTIFMALYGGNILSIAWGYPSEILTPKVTMVPNIIGWIATAMVTSIPPLVVGAMPHGNAYPLFLFFGIYGFLSYVPLQFFMVQSKDRTYEQIIDNF